MTSVSTAYISASTNRFSHAADISSSSLVAFGSSKLVALWDPNDRHDRGVHETLPGHAGDITCVYFPSETSFVSADDQGYVRCWRKLGSQWKTTVVVQAHQKAVSALCVLDRLLVTGGSDSAVKVWRVDVGDEKDELVEVQGIPLKGKYPLSLALTVLPHSNAIMLAIGGTDHNVHIWTRSDVTFIRSVVLPGHEDWIRSLAFRDLESTNDPLVLASGSQDGTIRLWNIEIITREKTKEFSLTEAGVEQLTDELLDAFEASLGDLTDEEEGGRQISLKRHVLTVKSDQYGSQQFSITFDALLIGHEAGITSLSWRPAPNPLPPNHVQTLLSTSTDSSVILWSPSNVITSSHDGLTSIWINRQRFGDIGGQRLGGFVGGLWAKEGLEAMAWGWGGGWRRWRTDDEISGKQGIESWIEIGAIGGHRGPVKGVDWSPNGEFLLSVGLDQTTRLHAAVQKTDSDGAPAHVWHELSRPQVHGYDIVGVSFLDALKFTSIADEKVARVFEAPRVFVDLTKGLGVLHSANDSEERPLFASVPPLGLSNKAIKEESSLPVKSQNDTAIRRPFEGELASTTLWPEIEKVFGHGYELISLGASNDKRMVATACRASSADYAVIRVYETSTWQSFGLPLEGHALTVTRIAFSPDDQYILTVSRDRSWRLFEKKEDGFIPIAADKSHTRIVWDCAWSVEGDTFATASRDKTVKIWETRPASNQWAALATLKVKEAATAVAFCSANVAHRRRLAVGLETGEILIYSSLISLPSKWDLDLTIESGTAHINQIHQMSWRPSNGDNTQIRQLASCSEDGTLKILTVRTE